MATCQYKYRFSGNQDQYITLNFNVKREASNQTNIDTVTFSNMNFTVQRSGGEAEATSLTRDAVLVLNTTFDNYGWQEAHGAELPITNVPKNMLSSGKNQEVSVNKFQDFQYTIRAALYNFRKNGVEQSQGFLYGISVAENGPPWSASCQYFNDEHLSNSKTINVPNKLNHSTPTITHTGSNTDILEGTTPSVVSNVKINNNVSPKTDDPRNLIVSWTRPTSNDSGYYKVKLYLSTNGGSSYTLSREQIVANTNSFTFSNVEDWSAGYMYKAEVQTLGSNTGTEEGIRNSGVVSAIPVTIEVSALALTAVNTTIKFYTNTIKVTPQLSYTSGANIFYKLPNSNTYISYNSTNGISNPTAGTYTFKVSKSGYTDVTLDITLVNGGVPFAFTSTRYAFYYNGGAYNGYKTLTITGKVPNSSNTFWVGGGTSGTTTFTSNGTASLTIDIGNALSTLYSSNEFLKNFSVTSRYQTSEIEGSYAILSNQYDKKRTLTYNNTGTPLISGIASNNYYNTIKITADYDGRFTGNISFKISTTTVPFTLSNGTSTSVFTLNTSGISVTGILSGVYFGGSFNLNSGNTISKGTPPISAASFSTDSKNWPVYTEPNFGVTINTTLSSNWNSFTYSLFLKDDTSSTPLALTATQSKFTATNAAMKSAFYSSTTPFKTEMTARFPQQIQNVTTNLYIGAKINNEIIQMFPVQIIAVFNAPYTFSNFDLGTKTLKAGTQKNISFNATNPNPYKTLSSCSYRWRETDAYTTTSIGANSSGSYNLNLICPSFTQSNRNTFYFKVEEQTEEQTYCYFVAPNIAVNVSDASFSDITGKADKKNFNITIGFYDPGNTIDGTSTVVTLTDVTLRIPGETDTPSNSNTTYTFEISASLATSNLTYQLLFKYTQTCTYENEPVTFTQDIITDSLTMFGENPSISIRNKVMGINIIPESDEDYFLLLSPLSSTIKKIAFTDGSKTGNVLNIIGYIDLVNKTIDGFTIGGGTW